MTKNTMQFIVFRFLRFQTHNDSTFPRLQSLTAFPWRAAHILTGESISFGTVEDNGQGYSFSYQDNLLVPIVIKTILSSRAKAEQSTRLHWYNADHCNCSILTLSQLMIMWVRTQTCRALLDSYVARNMEIRTFLKGCWNAETFSTSVVARHHVTELLPSEH